MTPMKPPSTELSFERLPDKPGVYLFRNAAGGLLYVGKAVKLRRRVASYFRQDVEPKTRALMAEVRQIDYLTSASEREALLVEQRLIQRHQPAYNVMWKDGKSYPYVMLTWQEDFPRLVVTRERRRDGARYFGPYPHTSLVRHLLEWSWKKKLFPLRPCSFVFDRVHPLAQDKINSCLYFHTQECPAPCAGRIGYDDYRAIAKSASLFFEGQNSLLRDQWCREMKIAAQTLQFEKAAHLRDALYALEHVGQRVSFRAVQENDVLARIQSSQSVQALQEALALPQPPERIEGFDVSHHQGEETVASLVVFLNGRPLSSGYRRYRLRSVSNGDDPRAMEEVVFRRYQRVKREGSLWPDLILIDGGLAQLAAAQRSIQRVTQRPIPLVSLAKRAEEVYRPDITRPLQWPANSPALQLLQHVRDESHRFAVTFHRQRRARTLTPRRELP